MKKAQKGEFPNVLFWFIDWSVNHKYALDYFLEKANPDAMSDEELDVFNERLWEYENDAEKFALDWINSKKDQEDFLDYASKVRIRDLLWTKKRKDKNRL